MTFSETIIDEIETVLFSHIHKLVKWNANSLSIKYNVLIYPTSPPVSS